MSRTGAARRDRAPTQGAEIAHRHRAPRSHTDTGRRERSDRSALFPIAHQRETPTTARFVDSVLDRSRALHAEYSAIGRLGSRDHSIYAELRRTRRTRCAEAKPHPLVIDESLGGACESVYVGWGNEQP